MLGDFLLRCRLVRWCDTTDSRSEIPEAAGVTHALFFFKVLVKTLQFVGMAAQEVV